MLSFRVHFVSHFETSFSSGVSTLISSLFSLCCDCPMCVTCVLVSDMLHLCIQLCPVCPVMCAAFYFCQTFQSCNILLAFNVASPVSVSSLSCNSLLVILHLWILFILLLDVFAVWNEAFSPCHILLVWYFAHCQKRFFRPFVPLVRLLYFCLL